MAAPSFVQAGAGALWQTGAAQTASLASTTVGNVIIFQGMKDGGTGTVALSSITNIEDLAAAGSSMTQIGTDHAIGSPKVEEQILYIGRATSTSVSLGFASSGSTDDVYARLYEFSGVHTGTALSDVIENGGSDFVNEAGSSDTIADTGVTTNGADRLACNFVGVNDDNALDAFTGMTGGTWAEAVAEYATATGTDGAIGLQIATIASAGTINGGSDTMVAIDNWGVVGFALKPAATAPPTSLLLPNRSNQVVLRQR